MEGCWEGRQRGSSTPSGIEVREGFPEEVTRAKFEEKVNWQMKCRREMGEGIPSRENSICEGVKMWNA